MSIKGLGLMVKYNWSIAHHPSLAHADLSTKDPGMTYLKSVLSTIDTAGFLRAVEAATEFLCRDNQQ